MSCLDVPEFLVSTHSMADATFLCYFKHVVYWTKRIQILPIKFTNASMIQFIYSNVIMYKKCALFGTVSYHV
jgi:hypothetical protein